MKPLRVGVIGVGYLGQHHARLYAGLPDVTLVGVVDADGQRAKQIAEKHGAAVYHDVAALLGQVDAVSVAVPTSDHYAVAKQCLEAGVHALVEKPLVPTPAEAQALVRVAQEKHVQLQVGHIERFNPIMRQVRPLITKPLFVECHRLSPFTGRGADVDVVLDLMIHDLDMVLSFQPGAIEDIRATGVPVVTDTLDMANARIAFSSGCVANLTASRVSADRMRTLRVFQRDGDVSVDYQTRQASVSRRRSVPGRQPELSVERFQGSDEEPLKLELDAFLQAVRTGTRPIVSGEDGAAAIALAHRIVESIEGLPKRHATA